MNFLPTWLLRFSTHPLSLIILIGLLSLPVCHAQTMSGRRLMMFGRSAGPASDTVFLDIDQDIAGQLLPFDELVKVAVAYSPLIKYQNEIASSLNASYRLAKLQILQNVNGFANYSTGDQSIISNSFQRLDQNVTPGQITNSTLGQIANGYRVGVDVRVGLYDLFGGRRQQIRQTQSNYRAAIVQKDIIELQIRRELITIYQDIITAQQVLKVRLLDEQASLAALRIAEVELQQGKVNADAVANATNRYAQTKSYSEQVKGDFLKNVHTFEALVGVPIQRLKRN